MHCHERLLVLAMYLLGKRITSFLTSFADFQRTFKCSIHSRCKSVETESSHAN